MCAMSSELQQYMTGNYALQAGLVPSRDALVLEPGEHSPYANELVVIFAGRYGRAG